jgi:hypothetical protein
MKGITVLSEKNGLGQQAKKSPHRTVGAGVATGRRSERLATSKCENCSLSAPKVTAVAVILQPFMVSSRLKCINLFDLNHTFLTTNNSFTFRIFNWLSFLITIN